MEITDNIPNQCLVLWRIGQCLRLYQLEELTLGWIGV